MALASSPYRILDLPCRPFMSGSPNLCIIVSHACYSGGNTGVLDQGARSDREKPHKLFGTRRPLFCLSFVVEPLLVDLSFVDPSAATLVSIPKVRGLIAQTTMTRFRPFVCLTPNYSHTFFWIYKEFHWIFFPKTLFFISRTSAYMTKWLGWKYYNGSSHDDL